MAGRRRVYRRRRRRQRGAGIFRGKNVKEVDEEEDKGTVLEAH